MTRPHVVVWLLMALLVGGAARARAAEPQPATVPDTMEQRLLACAPCHGKNGEGGKRSETFPRLAGKAEGYLYNQLLNFRDGRRSSPAMNYMLGFLSDAYLSEIAQYYSRLHPPYPSPVSGVSTKVLALGEALVRKGDPSRNLPACSECHGKALVGAAPFIPGLVGLSPAYITLQLGNWRTESRHAREPDCMAKIASLLSPEEISALADWLASQPPPASASPPLANAAKLPMECGSIPKR